MTHPSSTLLEQAKQGSPRAIAQLINRALEPKGITVKVSRDGNRLTLFAEASETPNQESLVGIVRRGIKDLGTDVIHTIKLYGRKAGGASTDWSDEITLKVLLPAQVGGANNPTDQFFSNLAAQIQTTVRDLVKIIRKIRIGKRTAYGLGGFVLLAIVSFAGITGFHAWQVHSNQAATIGKAETIVKDASDTTKAKSIADLSNSIEQLKQAGLLLQGIPTSSGSLYQKAQVDLGKVRSQINELEQRVKKEEAASTTLVSADRMAQEALSTTKSSIKLQDWQTASSNLQQAISQLETIPPDSFIAEQVRAKLATYKTEGSNITKNIGIENKALQALELADKAAQQALDITDSKSEYTISDLQSAQVAWQNAIKLLKAVPAKSVAAAGIEHRRSVYTGNIGKLAVKLKELNQCLKTSSLKDTCGYLSLGLTSPPGNRSSTYSTSDIDFSESTSF